MPVQIINDPYRSFGASIGQSVGSGVGQTLQYLANKKLSQLEERQRKAEQQALFQQAGYSPEQAALLGNYSQNPAEQLKLAQMLGQVAPQQQQQPTFFQQQPSIQEYQEPMAQLQQQPSQWMQGLQQLQQGPQDQGIQAQQSLSQRLGLPELPTTQFGKRLSEALQQGQLQPELVQQQARPMAQPMMAQQPQMQPMVQPQQQQRAPLTTAQRIGQYESPQDRRERLKMEQRERHFQAKQERERESIAREESKELRKQLNSDNRASKEKIHELDRLEELDQKGKLDTAGYVEFLKRSGFDIPALLNPDSAEYNKIVQNFTRDAKSIFGSRVSNFEIDQFLKTLPSLSMSPEGRKQVIANLKRIERGKQAYYKAYREVLDENRGVPPLNLDEEIQDRVDPFMDKVYSQWRKDLDKPVPKGQNKIITAIQAGLGSAVGAVPELGKTAAKAGIGALAGSAFGPAGTAIGGTLGALGSLKGLI